MKTVWIAFLLVLSALLVPACDAPPKAVALNARDVYVGTMDVLVHARDMGYIDDETALEIEEWRQDAALALDAMEEAALNNDQVGFSFAREAFWNAMDPIIERRLEAERQMRSDEDEQRDAGSDGSSRRDEAGGTRLQGVGTDAA